MPGERRQRSYRLTDDAVAGLDRMATRHRVTVTALLEAFGQLAQGHDPTPNEVIARATQIDRERLNRRPRD